nr:MAG TPA: hypothetical protein [Caudoviricetes sp.]
MTFWPPSLPTQLCTAGWDFLLSITRRTCLFHLRYKHVRLFFP